MRKEACAVLAVVALALGASSAMGQETPPVDQPIHHTEAAPAAAEVDSFAAIDHDSDGFIQWEEMRNVTVKAFQDADHDQSGALTGNEMKLEEAKRPMIDLNKGGKISQRELVAYMAAVFGQADVNADEKLSREEATADTDAGKEESK